VNTAKIALFHLNRDKNVGSRSNREDQMADSHFWCSPKRDNETYHNWMADKAVKPRGPKTEILVLLVKKDLPQAKQIEVINQKGADENDGPAGKGHDPQDQKTRRAFNVPDNSEQGLPLPKKQIERETREQHIGAALNYPGNKSGPEILKPGPRHEAVLDSKQAEQRRVNYQRLGKGPFPAGIDCLRHDEISHKPYRVEKRDEKNQVTDCSVEESENSPHF